MSMPAMTAFTQLLHLFSPLRLRPPVRPRAPKKGHYSGRTTKAKTVTPLTKGDAFNPAYPHKCASFPSPVSVSLRRHAAAGTRQSTQEINLSISKFTVAEHNKCRERSGRTRTWPLALARSTLLQVLLFPAFQCAVLADRTKEEEEDGPAPAGGQRGSMNPSNQP